jgi:hypothetical protein
MVWPCSFVLYVSNFKFLCCCIDATFFQDMMEFNFISFVHFKGVERKMPTVTTHRQLSNSSPLTTDRQLSMLLFRKLIQAKRHVSEAKTLTSDADGNLSSSQQTEEYNELLRQYY